MPVAVDTEMDRNLEEPSSIGRRSADRCHWISSAMRLRSRRSIHDLDRLLGQIIVFRQKKVTTQETNNIYDDGTNGGETPNDQIIGVRRGAYLVSVAERTGGWQRRINPEADLVHAESTGRA